LHRRYWRRRGLIGRGRFHDCRGTKFAPARIQISAAGQVGKIDHPSK
jgi:hypothetical protein